MSTRIVRNWWSFALNGVIALIYGFLALFLPDDTLIVVARYTGIVILLAGIVFAFVAYNRVQKQIAYGIILAEAIVLVVLGILILVYTVETISFFVSLIGIWAIVLGIIQLIALVDIGQQMANKNFFLINAIVSLLFGALLLLNPFAAIKTLVIISGLLALFFGFVMIWFAFNLKSLQKGI
jgi:uncharacterized membrane protein HdeD (DUF308 family)